VNLGGILVGVVLIVAFPELWVAGALFIVVGVVASADQEAGT